MLHFKHLSINYYKVFLRFYMRFIIETFRVCCFYFNLFILNFFRFIFIIWFYSVYFILKFFLLEWRCLTIIIHLFVFVSSICMDNFASASGCIAISLADLKRYVLFHRIQLALLTCELNRRNVCATVSVFDDWWFCLGEACLVTFSFIIYMEGW